jgi:hypothetical protein
MCGVPEAPELSCFIFALSRDDLKRRTGLEQADLKALGRVNLTAINRDGAVGDTHSQPAVYRPRYVELVCDELRGRQHLAAKFHFADAERAPFALASAPTEPEPDKLP